jgi:hypothetical protein
MMKDNAMNILGKTSMHPLRVAKDTVSAYEVFPDEDSWKDLLRSIELQKDYEKRTSLPDAIEAINGMKVDDGYVPEEISHQEVLACDTIRQAGLISKAEFFRAIAAHPLFRDVQGFARQKRVIRDTLHVFNLLRSIGNLFRTKKIHTVLGSKAEVNVAWKCFGPLWPAGLNMYGVLRDLYPAFHARITGQVPVYLAENMGTLLNGPLPKKDIFGIGRFLVGGDGRFLGLYPVGQVPAEHVTLQSPFISQDQVGRKAIVARLFEDIVELIREDGERPVHVIDYAGGPGNLSEILLKTIFELDDQDLKSRLMRAVRAVVVDIAGDQLEAGRRRFDCLDRKAPYHGIRSRIAFIEADVTRSLGRLLNTRDIAGHGGAGKAAPVYLGMTAYTLGALDNIRNDDGSTCAQAMAGEISRQCSRLYAVDFSSPLWRLDDFLRDTGRWGSEYLRTVHGVPDEEDTHKRLPAIVETAISAWYGVRCGTVAQFVRSMTIGPALAAHYVTVWPGSDGHNSGYTVQEDGSMKKPGILSFGETLQSCGAGVAYTSKIWLVATLDLGSIGSSNRAWAFAPGWMADFIVADMAKR